MVSSSSVPAAVSSATAGRLTARPEGPGGPAADPLTVRGSVNAIQPAIDYLKCTVWSGVEEVLTALETGVVGKYWSQQFKGWSCREFGGRVLSVWEAAGLLYVVVYRAKDGGQADYLSVEVKGEGCENLGFDGLAQVLFDIRDFRPRPSRLDCKWDGVAFSVDDVLVAGEAGQFISRCFRQDQVKYWRSTAKDEGRGVGIGVRAADRYLRVYDRRGFVRLELELKGGWAESACGLIFSGSEDPQAVMWRFLRGSIDFADRSDGSAARDSVLLPWWRDFVEGHARGKVASISHESELSLEALGIFEMAVARSAKRLAAAVKVLGPSYVLKRIEQVASLRWGSDDEKYLLELWRNGLHAGLIRHNEVPF
jgi:hypothetical protein